jgi:hypothetical protein
VSRGFADVLGSNQAAAKDSAWISRWSRTIVVSRLPFPSRVAAKRGDHLLQADFAGLIRLGDAERRQSCVYPRLVYGVIRTDM